MITKSGICVGEKPDIGKSIGELVPLIFETVRQDKYRRNELEQAMKVIRREVQNRLKSGQRFVGLGLKSEAEAVRVNRRGCKGPMPNAAKRAMADAATKLAAHFRQK